MLIRLILYSLAAWMLASNCLAQAQTVSPQPAPSDLAATASSEPGAVLKRFHDYAKSNPLDFETSFDARMQGDELYRGSAHFLIRRPNLFRIETSSSHSSYLLVSDGKVMMTTASVGLPQRPARPSAWSWDKHR